MAKKTTKTTRVRTSNDSAQTLPGASLLMVRGAVALVFVVIAFLVIEGGLLDTMREKLESQIGGGGSYGNINDGDAELATFFTPEVRYWSEQIKQWGQQRNLNPNLIATIMQIESCGDPFVSSGAGAQGLFQVMPLHFDDGENQVNPERNAQNGLDHLTDCLTWSNYDVGVTFACYNAGPSIIGSPRSQWPGESQSYYRWGTGIFGDAARGSESSSTLSEWLSAGGSGLCERASNTQQQVMPYLVSEAQGE
jgi:hypothetical protein